MRNVLLTLAMILFVAPMALASPGGVQMEQTPAPPGGTSVVPVVFNPDGSPNPAHGMATDTAPSGAIGGNGKSEFIEMPDGKIYEWDGDAKLYICGDEWVKIYNVNDKHGSYIWGGQHGPYSQGTYDAG